MKTVDLPLLRRREAADYLSAQGYPIKCQTLARAAVEGWGPPFITWGRWPLYRPDELLSWAECRAGQRRNSTMEVSNA